MLSALGLARTWAFKVKRDMGRVGFGFGAKSGLLFRLPLEFAQLNH